jgi:AcrR family transcriptional regulator
MSTPQSPSLRQRHADVTRRAILEAALGLFTDNGYANTSIRRLAEHANVAVQTIYATFRSKPGVLFALLDLLDQEKVEPIARRLMEAEDPGEMLDLAAALERQVREAHGDLMRIVARAAATDAEVAPVWDQLFERHRRGVAGMCERLASSGALRIGLTVDKATATALALTSVEAYEEVVHHQGFSHEWYEQWLAGALRQALLGADHRAQAAGSRTARRRARTERPG